MKIFPRRAPEGERHKKGTREVRFPFLFFSLFSFSEKTPPPRPATGKSKKGTSTRLSHVLRRWRRRGSFLHGGSPQELSSQPAFTTCSTFHTNCTCLAPFCLPFLTPEHTLQERWGGEMEMEKEVRRRGGGGEGGRRRRGKPVSEGLFVGVHSTLQHGRVQDSTFPHRSLRSPVGVSSPDLPLRYSAIYAFVCSLIAVISQRQTRSGQSRAVCLSDFVSCRALDIAERVAGE